MSKVDVIILAGAPAGPEMDPGGVLKSRAMIQLGDKTMLQWVVDALQSAASVGRIAAVGHVEAEGLDLVLEPGDDIMSNMKRGIEALKTDKPVLIVSSDVPLLTSAAVDDFIDQAEKLGVDLAYPIITKDNCEARYPGFKRTYLKTADGVFTGGNIMLVRPDFIFRNWESISAAYGARKHVLELARMIGICVLFRVIAAQVFPGALKVSMLERAVSRMLGARMAAVVSAYPEIGEDVDKPSDVEAVKRILLDIK